VERVHRKLIFSPITNNVGAYALIGRIISEKIVMVAP